MNTLSVGPLRFRIKLLRPVISRDEQTGAPIKFFEFVPPMVSAGIKAISNRKIRTGDQGQVIETLLITLRPRADVSTDWQVIWMDRTFTIRAADRSLPDRVLLTAEADTRHD